MSPSHSVTVYIAFLPKPPQDQPLAHALLPSSQIPPYPSRNRLQIYLLHFALRVDAKPFIPQATCQTPILSLNQTQPHCPPVLPTSLSTIKINRKRSTAPPPSCPSLPTQWTLHQFFSFPKPSLPPTSTDLDRPYNGGNRFIYHLLYSPEKSKWTLPLSYIYRLPVQSG